MRRKFIRTLVAVLAAVVVVGFVYPDDLWDYDVAGQSEMVTGSPERLPSPQDWQAVDFSSFAALNKNTSFPSSDVRTTSRTLVSLSTCILRC
jgi:hypothetical protein